MNRLLKLEELAQLLLAVYYLYSHDMAWYFYLIMFIGPDVSMVGYLINARIGAWSYNLLHHKGLAVLVFLFGWVAIEPTIAVIGVILYGHSSMDRIFGYGLKHESGFKFTHLGAIGNT